MTGALSSVFPRPRANDTDDVVWTLQTAAVQWQRGLRADAIVWVRRAADTSVQMGHLERAEELREYAARLAEYLWSDPQEAPADNGLSNPAMPQHPQTLQEIAALDELEEDALILDEYDVQISSRRSGAVPSEEVTDLTLEDLEGDARDRYLSESVSPDELLLDDDLLDDDLLDDDLELIEDDKTPPDGVPSSIGAISIAEELVEENEEPRDSFLSVSPDDDVPPGRDSYASISPESDASLGSERPTLPHLGDTSLAGLAELALSTSSSSSPSPDRISSIPPTLRRNRLGDRSSSVPVATMTERPHESPELEISASDPAALRAELLDSPLDGSLDEALASAVLQDLAAVELLNEKVASAPAVGVRLQQQARVEIPEGPAEVDGQLLEEAEILADLPEDAHRLLVATAEHHTVGAEETLLLEEGVALVTEGTVHILLDGSGVSAARVSAGQVVAVDGSLGRQPLEIMADGSAPRLAVWRQETLDAATSDCPWVVDDLRVLADRFQAQAGAGQGELGARLDDALRAAVYDRLEVRVLKPQEVVAVTGEPLSGLFIVAGGALTATREGQSQTLNPGEFVFASCVIGAEPAPANVVAGADGALVLYAARPLAHELMMSVPPLLEILAG